MSSDYHCSADQGGTVKKKNRKLPPFEAMYPTQHARHAADREFDKLPLSTSLGECIRVWEYLKGI